MDTLICNGKRAVSIGIINKESKINPKKGGKNGSTSRNRKNESLDTAHKSGKASHRGTSSSNKMASELPNLIDICNGNLTKTKAVKKA